MLCSVTAQGVRAIDLHVLDLQASINVERAWREKAPTPSSQMTLCHYRVGGGSLHHNTKQEEWAPLGKGWSVRGKGPDLIDKLKTWLVILFIYTVVLNLLLSFSGLWLPFRKSGQRFFIVLWRVNGPGPEKIAEWEPLKEAAKLVMLTQIAETWSFHLVLDLGQICKVSDNMEYCMYCRYQIRRKALYSPCSQGPCSYVSVLPTPSQVEPPAFSNPGIALVFSTLCTVPYLHLQYKAIGFPP